MRECKLRGRVKWQAALKQKGVKQTGTKQGLCVCVYYLDEFQACRT
jgi:hypothetical protein